MTLPLYEATIDDLNDGIYCISLVSDPATEVEWVKFAKQKKVEYAIDDEEQHILAGVVMLADTPIYRRDEYGYEYNIVYHKDTIKQMAEKMLADNTHNNIDIQHNEKILERGKVQLVELFIKDVDNGINPSYFDSIPNGSLLAKYKIHDVDLWESCKQGEFKGFSLAGYFSVNEEKFRKTQKYNKISMLKRIREALASLLMEYTEIKTDKAVIYAQGSELAEGIVVTDQDENPIEDGEYKTEDGKTITIVDSKINNITTPFDEPEKPEEQQVEEPNETPEEPKDEPEKKEDDENNNENPENNEETPENNENPEEPEKPVDENTETPEEPEQPTEPEVNPEQPEIPQDNTDVTALIGALQAEITDLKEQIKNLIAQPAVEPITEEFNIPMKTSIDKSNKAANVLSHLHD